jgi:C4-dicarboxylate transporter DctM subunit
LNSQAFARFASYDLSVIPLFILMGHFATQGGISRALFQFAAAVMGGFRGGLAMAAVLACAAFGAICGSSVATAATITGVALPEMKRHGYSGRLSTGTLAAGGTLGILIPPSVPLVIYAILTEQNIAKLFAAAMVPGVIAMVGYMIAIAIYVRVVPGQAPEVDDDRPAITMASLAGIVPIALIFILVFGGIYGGLFTPTKAQPSARHRPSWRRCSSARSPGRSSRSASMPRRELGDDLPDLHRC